MCPVRHRNEEKGYFLLDFLKYLTNKTTVTFFKENYLKKLRYQIVRFIILVPNCPGAKLSVFTMLVPNLLFFFILVPNCLFAFLVPNCLFAFLVPNCPFLPSWCQIVQVPNCPVPNCPTTDVYTYLSMTQECLVFRFQKIYSRLSTLRE